MLRGPLYRDDYCHQFSGHETFPMRYGWLKKAYDAVEAAETDEQRKAIFGEEAIASFGVGKNMVSSIRHWAKVTGIIDEPQGTMMPRPAEIGRTLFGENGLDPYMEHPATLWLIHWQLAALPTKTTWFWAFNHYQAVTFERENLVNALSRLAKDRSWSRVATATLKNDVACFIRTYVAPPSSARSGKDDALESPLTELGLIKATGKRDGFRFVRGEKSSLGDGVFAYALMRFWASYAERASTLSFEAIAHEPGGPGRVFQLDENDVADRLSAIDEVTDGGMRWSETAGLKQVVRESGFDLGDALSFVAMDYVGLTQRKAA
jgi:hypothetical protein